MLTLLTFSVQSKPELFFLLSFLFFFPFHFWHCLTSSSRYSARQKVARSLISIMSDESLNIIRVSAADLLGKAYSSWRGSKSFSLSDVL